MNKTNIEWVKNPDGTKGYTWNPITGCLNHTPNGLCLGGLFPCYAHRLANGRLQLLYLSNHNVAETDIRSEEYAFAITDSFYPRFWPKRLNELHDRNRALMERNMHVPKERGIFVCDMGELFGDWLPEAWTREVLNAIDLNKGYDRFYLLTKQPQNLPQFSPFPENCWVGVTVTDRYQAHKTFMHFSHVKGVVKFLSLEPLLDDVTQYLYWPNLVNKVDWLIIGAQTNPYRPPKASWVWGIIEAASEAGIPVFLKDNLYPLLGLGRGESICHNNEVVTLRQEFPNLQGGAK